MPITSGDAPARIDGCAFLRLRLRGLLLFGRRIPLQHAKPHRAASHA